MITTGRKKFTVQDQSWHNGGGPWFGQEYIDIIKQRYPDRKFDRCLEWCSGPGYIGYNILDHDLCNHLVLIDKFAEAIEFAQRTAANCPKLVTTYVTDTLSVLPESEQFDLIVANPPHYLECPGDDNYQRIAVDTNWAAHQDFYQHIGQHLLPQGLILIQENMAGSLGGIKDFEPFIHSNGLQIIDWFTSPKYFDITGPTQIYYIEIAKRTNTS
jgi:methylase of polypeptide subunit release factors